MPPRPLDERIVVIQRPKSLALRVASPQTAPPQHGSSNNSGGGSSGAASRFDLASQHPLPSARIRPHPALTANGSSSGGGGGSWECKRRSRSQKVRGERGERGWENGIAGGVGGHVPSHCHSNGTVTLGPRPHHKHTHTIDIHLSLDKGGGGGAGRSGGSTGTNHNHNHNQAPDKGARRSSSLTRGGSTRSGRGGRKVSLHLDPAQERRNGGVSGSSGGGGGGGGGCGSLGKGGSGGILHSSQKPQPQVSHHQNHLSVSPGGVLEFVPAQRNTQTNPRKERDYSTCNGYSASGAGSGSASRGDHHHHHHRGAPVSNGNKENTKLGPVPVQQTSANPPHHSLPRHHGPHQPPLTPHATLLNTPCPPPPPPPQIQAPPPPPYPSRVPPHPPNSSSTSATVSSSSAGPFPPHPRPSARTRDHNPHHSSRHHHPPHPHFPPQLQLHGFPPLSPTASSREGFPSPDHTCTIDLAHPFSCGCWKLVRCRGGRSHGHSHHSHSHHSHGHHSHNHNHAQGAAAAMGLKTLGGCLSTASTTTNTSSSNSTASECRAGLLRGQLGGCASCSSETAAGVGGDFRKKLVGGCLPCAPLSSSAPLRALQSCVTGCNPKASQTASSTCSYCSSDPIVVTFNPHRSKQQQQQHQQQQQQQHHQQPPLHGSGRGGGFGPIGGIHDNDDDYSVRTIWPEELAKKINRSKVAQGNSHHHMGAGCMGHEQNGGHGGHSGGHSSGGGGSNPVILDCRNLLEFTRSQLTDHAGRRRLQQGKSAVLDFIGSGGVGAGGRGGDSGRDSLKRLWTGGGGGADVGMMGDSNGLGDDDDDDVDDMMMMMPPRSPSPRPPSSAPQSPPSFSPPPSAHGTLIKPKPRQRDNGSGHNTLPSAHSLHLVLNSYNQEQDEDNGRVHLSLPLSSSLPASLDESLMTPDVENAVISPILPFLFLGNERDAQDLELLVRLDICYVVNVTTHLPLYHLETGLVRYKRLPATDNSRQNLRQYFEEVFEFIEEAHQSGRGVLVHCQAGVSRSATIVIAYLMKHTLMTMTDAYKYVRGRRPVVSPNLNFMGQLLEFERDLNSGVTPRILTPKLTGLETQV
ncbi:uncharacterized protein si:dkey-175m17.7 [Engraulis encrasicolus]|uniref:uncharacterized protein si:dkey-175m17.7 n=2 Tax=Clupeoidei TaxID=1489460 RepID=UPI002FD295D8